MSLKYYALKTQLNILVPIFNLWPIYRTYNKMNLRKKNNLFEQMCGYITMEAEECNNLQSNETQKHQKDTNALNWQNNFHIPK